MRVDGVLDNLSREELDCLVSHVRRCDPCLVSMSDAEVVAELLSGGVRVNEIANCPDRNVRLALVRKCGWALHYVPIGQRDRELCLVAVMEWGQALYSVPEPLRDLEMCRSACANFDAELSFVPESVRDLQSCLAAISIADNLGDFVKWRVPEPIKASIREWLGLDGLGGGRGQANE